MKCCKILWKGCDIMNYNEFLDEVKALRSPATYDNYRYALAKFKNPTKANILKYISESKDSSTTKKNRLRILGIALRWYNKMDKGIERIIKGYRENVPIEPCPTDEQIEAAWNNLGSHRDKAMFALMAYAGLRIGEVQKLDRSDVDMEHEQLIVRNTKGKRDAIIPLVNQRLRGELYAWMTESDNRWKALFVTENGRMSLKYLKNKFHDIFHDIGFPYHAHSLRRYYANCLANAGVPLQDMAICMRHAKVETTMRYLNLNQQNVKAALQRTWAEHTA